MIDQIRELGEAFAKAAVPGAYLVELIPVMRYLPQWLASWKRQALQQHRYFSDMLLGLSGEVSSRMVSHAIMCSPLHIVERWIKDGTTATGEEQRCFVSALVERQSHLGLSNKECAWLAGTLLSVVELWIVYSG